MRIVRKKKKMPVTSLRPIGYLESIITPLENCLLKKRFQLKTLSNARIEECAWQFNELAPALLLPLYFGSFAALSGPLWTRQC